MFTVCLAIQLLHSSAFAHDGSKFEPDDGKVLHGAGQSQQAFDAYSAALGDSSLTPFITKEYLALWDRFPQYWLDQTFTWAQLQAAYFDPFRDWLDDQQGLMPEVSISYSLYNGVYGDQIVPTGALDPVIAETARIIRDFGAPCFVRLGFEPTGAKYNYGTPYIASYRRIVDIFRAEGADNVAFIWCAGASGGVIMATDGVWFPGDAYVDWIGVDLFSPSSIQPAPGSSLPWADSLWTMLHLANTRKKPVILSEASCIIPGGITDASPAAALDYWDQWFATFFDLIRSEPRIKAFSYINWDWPNEGFPFWDDARIENNPTLAALIADELSDSRYLHRDSPDKFVRPWMVELGQSVTLGGGVAVMVDNGDASAGSVAHFAFATQKLVTPGTPGFLDDDLGVYLPGLDQPWFLGPFFLTAQAPVAPDGTAQLSFQMPTAAAFASLDIYIQAAIFDISNNVMLTQPFELRVDP